MLDHLGIGVSNLARSRDFYVAALKPLGIGVIMEFPEAVGLGVKGKAFFWIGGNAQHATAHVAFAAKDRAAVDSFHRAALAAGGRDNGTPGLRPHYHANYYGAFVHDPDGHNIEAVCHAPPGAAMAATRGKSATARTATAKKRGKTASKQSAKKGSAKRRR